MDAQVTFIGKLIPSGMSSFLHLEQEMIAAEPFLITLPSSKIASQLLTQIMNL